jgi:hypothetical protein
VYKDNLSKQGPFIVILNFSFPFLVLGLYNFLEDLLERGTVNGEIGNQSILQKIINKLQHAGNLTS